MLDFYPPLRQLVPHSRTVIQTEVAENSLCTRTLSRGRVHCNRKAEKWCPCGGMEGSWVPWAESTPVATRHNTKDPRSQREQVNSL